MHLKIEYLHDQDKWHEWDDLRLSRKHEYDAGADIPMYKDITVKHGKNIIPLGFKLILPPGMMAVISPRSSVMGDGCIYNFTPIDSDYAGEYNLIIFNNGDEFTVKKGERIAQLVILPVIYADFTVSDVTRRGDNGIGSTGK